VRLAGSKENYADDANSNIAMILSLSLAGATLLAAVRRARARRCPRLPKASTKPADRALAAMQKRAAELNIGGAAVVAWFEGESIHSWVSKMVVVKRYKDEPSGTNKGSNLLGIAYTKAAEMADTLKDSGSKVREPMTGEYGWQARHQARQIGILDCRVPAAANRKTTTRYRRPGFRCFSSGVRRLSWRSDGRDCLV